MEMGRHQNSINKRLGKVSIWTRGQDLVNKSFPELVENTLYIKDDFRNRW